MVLYSIVDVELVESFVGAECPRDLAEILVGFGDVSSSSAMKQEWVDEPGECVLMISAEGSSKIESTADAGVLASDVYSRMIDSAADVGVITSEEPCRICRMEPKSHTSFGGTVDRAGLRLLG